MSALCNWLIAATIAFALGSTYMLDGPGATEEAQDIAAELRERQACGENAAIKHLANGSIQCQTKHGRNTQIVQVSK